MGKKPMGTTKGKEEEKDDGGQNSARSKDASSDKPREKKKVKKIGDYQIFEDKKLGSGAEGGTWICQHSKDVKEKFLCAKRIERNLVEENDSQYKCMVQEMEVLIKLAHPNLVQIHDIVSSKSAHYIIMDYYNGTNLYDLIQVRGFLRESEVHFLIKQIVVAFQNLTEQKILHRDLKPHNIMIHFQNHPTYLTREQVEELYKDLNKSRPTIKIVDFGHSFRGDNLQRDRNKGNPMTLSPEQLNVDKGNKQQIIDERADVWALGVTTYFLLTGLFPFSGYPGNADPKKAKALQQQQIIDGQYKIPKFLMISPLSMQFLNACMQSGQEDRPMWQDVANSGYIQEILLQDANTQKLDNDSKTLYKLYLEATQDKQHVGAKYHFLLRQLKDEYVKPYSTKQRVVLP